jgi:hypothetical protein
MVTICAWCKKVMKKGTGKITHGICPQCSAKLTGEEPKRKVYSFDDCPHCGSVRCVNEEYVCSGGYGEVCYRLCSSAKRDGLTLDKCRKESEAVVKMVCGYCDKVVED